MALWGNRDDKPSSGTIAINGSTGVVTGSGTAFLTQTKVIDAYAQRGTFGYIVVTTAGLPESYLITSVASNTSCKVKAGIPGSTMTTVSAGAQYTLNEKPRSISASSVHNENNPNDVYGIDTEETDRSEDNIVGISEKELGLGYPSAEVPAVTIAAPAPVVFATTAVTIATDTLTLAAAVVPTTGTAVKYLANSGTVLGGLVNGTIYFVIKLTDTTIALASTFANAGAGTKVALTGTGNNAQSLQGLTATAVAQFSGGSMVLGGTVMTGLGSNYASIPAVTIDSPRMTIATSAVTVNSSLFAFGGTRPNTAGFSLVYNNGGGTTATGLTSGTTYFIATGTGLEASNFQVKETNTITNPAGTVAITNTAGVFSMGATALAVDDVITISGTLGGTGSITGYPGGTGKSYRVSAVTGGAASSRTGFTLTEINNNAAIVTTAGTPTGLTYAIEDIPKVTGTGNNAQHFVIPLTATVVQATAEAIRGSGPGGSQITHAGWVREIIGTGGRAGRVNYETLVAMGSITGAANP
jgi:hypothetical protein